MNRRGFMKSVPIPLPSGLTFEDKGYFRFYSDGKVGLVHPVLLRPSIGLVEVEGRMEKTRTWEFAGQIVPEGYGEDGL